MSVMLCAALILVVVPLHAHKAKKTARVYFIEPGDGEQIVNPVHFAFGAENIDIAAAGENAHRAGHFHLLINIRDPLDMDEPIPFDGQHIHFSGGEREATISLPPGTHRLQLVLGDEDHQPWAEWLFSDPISVEVTE